MQRRSEQADAPLDSQLERGNEKRRSHKQHDRDALQRDQDKRGTTMLHLLGGADQLVLCCESTFGPEGVKNTGRNPGHVDSGRLRPEAPSGQDKVQEAVTAPSACLNTRQRRGGKLPRACWVNSGKSPNKIAQTSLQVTSVPRPTAIAERWG